MLARAVFAPPPPPSTRISKYVFRTARTNLTSSLNARSRWVRARWTARFGSQSGSRTVVEEPLTSRSAPSASESRRHHGSPCQLARLTSPPCPPPSNPPVAGRGIRSEQPNPDPQQSPKSERTERAPPSSLPPASGATLASWLKLASWSSHGDLNRQKRAGSTRDCATCRSVPKTSGVSRHRTVTPDRAGAAGTLFI